MNRFENLSLRTRLIATFGTVCALLVVAVGLGVWSSQTQTSGDNHRAALTQLARDADRITTFDDDISSWQSGYIIDQSQARLTNKDPNRVGELQLKGQLNGFLARFPVSRLTAREHVLFNGIVSAWQRFWSVDDAMWALARTGPAGLSANYRTYNTTQVAAVAEESSASAEEVSASTEQTSVSTQEIAASTQELKTAAQSLESLVARFKLES